MARYLALDWDTSEAHVAVVRTGSGKPQIEQAFSVSFPPQQVGTAVTEIDVGKWIAKEISSRKLNGIDTLIAIGRSNVEMRMLTIPPAPDDELPDLVRFQAQGHFSALGNDWTLDYLPISGKEYEQRQMLAAGISPQSIGQIHKSCETAQLQPRKLLLRACAAAALLKRQSQHAARGVQLMVDLLNVEADLTVLIDGEVVFMRTVRLPVNKRLSVPAIALASEIRRTIAAAHGFLDKQRVESVLLFGTSSMDTELHVALQESISLPVQLCDPFEHLALSGNLKSQCPDPGGFAPLLGALLDEADKQPHAIDFLHPRKKSEPPSHRRLAISIGATAALLVLALISALGWQIFALDNTIAQRRKQSANLDKAVESAKQRVDEVKTIDTWALNEVIWLKQLAMMSGRFPAPEAVRVSRFDALTRRGGGGEIVLNGFVDEHDTILQMENDLRDAAHRVVGTGGQVDESDSAYPWRFKERVLLAPVDPLDRPTPTTSTKAYNKDVSHPVRTDQ